jgi:hypothetical protein
VSEAKSPSFPTLGKMNYYDFEIRWLKDESGFKSRLRLISIMFAKLCVPLCVLFQNTGCKTVQKYTR